MAESQDADVYGTYTDGEIINHEQSFTRLIVIACGEHRYGWACEFECGSGQPLDQPDVRKSDPEGPYDNCRLYSGCYDSCSSTCHCFDGSADCNSVTGSCFSETCSLRRSGDKCQTDRFSIQTEKTNPGLALVHCMFSSIGQSMPSESINISRNDTFIGQASIIQSNYSTEDNVSRGSFYLESVGPDDILYCTVGLINGTQRPMSYARIPKREYYVLPELATQPSVSTIGLDQVMVMWRPWTPEKDLGDGPIIGYYIYVRSSDDDVTKEWIPSPRPDQQRTGNSTKSTGMLQNETLHRNITDLHPDTTYSLSLSVVREGLNGEGAEGDEIQFVTLPIPTTVPPTSVPPTTPTIEPGSMSQQNNVTSIAAGCSAGIILVILIVIVIILFVRYRNRKTKKRRRNSESLHYVNTPKTCYEEDGTGMDDLDGNEKDTLPYVNMEELCPTDNILQQTANSPGPNPPNRARTSPEKKPEASVEPIAQRDRIPVDEFPAFVQKNRHTDFFKEEFSSLPSGIQYRQTVAERPINAQKNRYKNILPSPKCACNQWRNRRGKLPPSPGGVHQHSTHFLSDDAHRVVLEHIEDEFETDYYNASYISNFKGDRAYIAAQGPNTASETDFWRMVWQENVKTIAMVTNLKEGNKRKCQKYWPNDINHTMEFGPYQVVLKSSVDGAAWVVRHLIIRQDAESHNVCQYHYTEWPDKGVPKHTSSLLMFLREVQAHHGQNKTPLLIHCSAGVGRTGVMIGIDGIVGGAKATGFVDVFSFVSNMRQNRPQMVQTAEQYEFLYHAVLEDLLFENTSIQFENFPSYIKGLKELLPGGKQTGLSKQFKNLQVVSPDPPEAMNRTALLAENQSKNRYGHILPLQRNRVILKSRDSEEDYINASFVKGRYFSFITTAMPMTNTVRDFWAMIYDYQPSHIVMLNDVHEDKTCEQYWSEKSAITQGCFTITVTSSKRDNNVIRRKLRVQHSKSLVYHDVDQYQLLKWCQGGHYSSLLTIIDQVQESSETLAEPSILVHCLSGVGRTGAFCSVMECIAQIAETGNVDVFQTIKELRVERTHFVQTESDYEDTYMILQDFLCKANTELTPSDNSDMEPTYANRESVYANTEPQYDNTEYQPDSGNGGHAENRTLLRGQTNAVYENVSFDLHEE
nr:receptor-type tyrosine-protein phosphatase alpha-like [Lytechinus pictus]